MSEDIGQYVFDNNHDQQRLEIDTLQIDEIQYILSSQ